MSLNISKAFFLPLEEAEHFNMVENRYPASDWQVKYHRYAKTSRDVEIRGRYPDLYLNFWLASSNKQSKVNVYVSKVVLSSAKHFQNLAWVLRLAHSNKLSTASDHSKQTTRRISKKCCNLSHTYCPCISRCKLCRKTLIRLAWGGCSLLDGYGCGVGGCHVKDSCSPLPMFVRGPHA